MANKPLSKEELIERLKAIAARSVPHEASVACSTAIALEWDAAWKKLNDPSGRAVKDVHENGYK